jgi:hypothetical protein
MLLIKLIIVILLLVIVISMASGLVFLIKDKGRSDRTLKALTLRIVLSIAAFALLMIAYAAGLITPHGLMNY